MTFAKCWTIWDLSYILYLCIVNKLLWITFVYFSRLPLWLHSQNCFELFIPDHKDQVIKACKTEADGRVVEGNHTVYRISAPTTEEKDEWMSSIRWGRETLISTSWRWSCQGFSPLHSYSFTILSSPIVFRTIDNFYILLTIKWLTTKNIYTKMDGKCNIYWLG